MALLSPANAWGHGAYHDVVRKLETKIVARPRDARLHLQLAQAHLSHDEWALCLTEIERVENLAPGEHETATLRARALHGSSAHEAARAVLDEFLAARPVHAEALEIRAAVLAALGEKQAAAADARAALETGEAVPPDRLIALGTTLRAAGMLEEALRCLERGLARQGNQPALLLQALDWESAAGRWDAALSRIDALQSAAPSPAPWMARRARLLAAAGRAADSRAAWVALREHLVALPSLARGTPQNLQLFVETRSALGEVVPASVSAPPSSSP